MRIINKAVFWDFDGTLVHSDSLWSNCVYQAINQTDSNNKITFEDIKFEMKTGFTWHTPNDDFSKLIDEKWWEYMFRRFAFIYRQLGTDGNNAEVASKRVRDLILKAENYSLYEDTILALKNSVKLGYNNYILSNNYPEINSVIDQLNLSQYFTDYIISAKVGYDKPRKELFECAKKIADYPELCFMVGDNPIADINGGNAAGMKTILVHTDAECCADYKLKKLSEISSILKMADIE